ncbi:15018_t:CDS:1, partial [Entrophospora sp. SA101]
MFHIKINQELCLQCSSASSSIVITLSHFCWLYLEGLSSAFNFSGKLE